MTSRISPACHSVRSEFLSCFRARPLPPWSAGHRLYNLALTADQARITQPHYNICPTQDALFVAHAGDRMKLREGRASEWLTCHTPIDWRKSDEALFDACR